MTTAKSKPFGRLTFLLSTAAALFLTFLLLALSKEASEGVRQGLMLCGGTLIPSLFPFLVLNNLWMRLGVLQKLGDRLGRPISSFFGISSSCASAILVGIVSGFPTGADVAYRLYERGLCDDHSLNRTVFLASLASPGFVIAGIGEGMLGDRRLGILLWGIQLLSTCLIGILDARLFPRRTMTPLSEESNENNAFFPCLSQALREGATAMVGICGVVLFFSVWITLLSLLPISYPWRCLLSCGLELTTGASLTSSLLPPSHSLIVLSAAVGWSGLSVHAQTVMVTGNRLHISAYLIRKAMTAILCALLAAIFSTIWF
ncbi:MAG: hypothetical protein IJD10_03700 [Clostridia bacterium]|nr:hypothetical protein [Clostridia bacterium]